MSTRAMQPTPTAAPPGAGSLPDGETAWAAVLARDPAFDGRFVYAVATTGIYCRPVCPSRRPLRRNVRFFATPAEAEAAGYRECRRCRPLGESVPAAVRSVERARAYLDEHLEENVTLERLSRAAHSSPYHLQRTFKRLVGVSPREYVRARRTERFKSELRQGSAVSRATYAAGFASPPGVELGMTPATYRRGGKGMEIRFTVAPSPLGRLLVAATERGVCAVTLGDEDDALEAALRREYPNARIQRGDEALGETVAAVASLLDGSADRVEMPLDVAATAFQWRVWKALQEIPRGTTLSYSAVAERIGAPTAARAVARACASNRVALVVPCHRVVREDGGMGGYRWGVERKQRLLEQESS